jgi:hypothetical protein
VRVRLVGVPHPALDADPSGLVIHPIALADEFDLILARRRAEADEFYDAAIPVAIRSISAWHREHPFSVRIGDSVASVDYEPAESSTNLFGGNSNWRGPIWMPLNVLLVEALRDYDRLAPGDLMVEYPTGSGVRLTIGQAADDISRRLVSIFLPGPNGRRPVHGWYELLATDPRWKDNIAFHEYFHGDTGMGLGASHQTGWTALVAHLILTGAR